MEAEWWWWPSQYGASWCIGHAHDLYCTGVQRTKKKPEKNNYFADAPGTRNIAHVLLLLYTHERRAFDLCASDCVSVRLLCTRRCFAQEPESQSQFFGKCQQRQPAVHRHCRQAMECVFVSVFARPSHAYCSVFCACVRAACAQQAH